MRLPMRCTVWKVLTNESFDYEMQGIVVDKSKPVNTIIYFGVKEMDE